MNWVCFLNTYVCILNVKHIHADLRFSKLEYCSKGVSFEYKLVKRYRFRNNIVLYNEYWSWRRSGRFSIFVVTDSQRLQPIYTHLLSFTCLRWYLNDTLKPRNDLFLWIMSKSKKKKKKNVRTLVAPNKRII